MLQKVESVTIKTENKHFRYFSGGPLYLDPQSKRIFLFYHAEIHRGTAKNFYSVLGLSVQTDAQGLEFKDLGPVFVANVSNEKAERTVEICGAPYIIKDGYFNECTAATLEKSYKGGGVVEFESLDDMFKSWEK